MITPKNSAAGFPHSSAPSARTAPVPAAAAPHDDDGGARDVVVAQSPPEAGSRLPCSDGRPKIVQGPSHDDWEKYQGIIIELYKEYPLKKVSDFMRKEYGFVASKRMYDKRFREWKVFKNLNSDEKERLLRRYQAIKRGGSPVEDDHISEEALRKTLRWAKTLAQGSKRAPHSAPGPTPSAAPNTRSPAAPPAATHTKEAGGLNIAELVESEDGLSFLSQSGLSETSSPTGEPAQTPPPQPKIEEHPRFDVQEDTDMLLVSPASVPAWPSPLPSWGSDDRSKLLEDRLFAGFLALSPSSSPQLPALSPQTDDTRPSSPQPARPFLFQGRPQQPGSAWQDEQDHPTSPSQQQQQRPLPLSRLGDPDPKTHSMSSIVWNLYSFFDWQMTRIPAGWAADDYLGLRTISDSAAFWSMIKNSLYVLKVSAYSRASESASGFSTESLPRAFPALAKAGPLAAPALIAHPFDFVLNILATLSPVNTRANPEVRGIILRLLETEAIRTLGEGPNHPIAALCRDLQADGDCQEVSRRAMQVLMDAFCMLGGGGGSDGGGSDGGGGAGAQVSFKLLMALAVQLRRGGDVAHATAIVEHVARSSLASFGPGSDHSRAAANELAHLRMKAGDLDSAMDLCTYIVRRHPPSLPPILVWQQTAAAGVSQPLRAGGFVTPLSDLDWTAGESKEDNTGGLRRKGGGGGEAEGSMEEDARMQEDIEKAGADDVYHQDRLAAHAMEDLAEMCEGRGQLEESLAWLHRAVNIAVREWGPKGIATGHIIDKVLKLQGAMGVASVLPESLLEQSATE